MDADTIPLLYLPLAWAGTVGTALTFIALAFAGIDQKRLAAGIDARNEFTPGLLVYAIWTIIGTALLLLLLDRAGISPDRIGLSVGLTPGEILAGTLGAIVCIRFWAAVEDIASTTGRPMFRALHLDNRQWLRPSIPEKLVLLALGAIVVPACEEIIFRGYLLTSLLTVTGSSIIAVVCTALAFASIHTFYGVGMVAYAFFVSILLSLLCLIFGNLHAAILMHSLINLWSFIVVPSLADAARSRPEE